MNIHRGTQSRTLELDDTEVKGPKDLCLIILMKRALHYFKYRCPYTSYCCVSKVEYKRFLSSCRRLKLLSINSFIMHESKSMNGWSTIPKNIFVPNTSLRFYLTCINLAKIAAYFYFQKRKKGRKRKFRNNKNSKLQNFLMKG